MRDLKGYLLTNAYFSAGSGLVMFVFQNQLTVYLGLTNSLVLPVLGVSLLCFAVFVYYVAIQHIQNRALVRLISGLDGIWVLGSFAITLFDLSGIDPQSHALINFVALWIACLVVGQLHYLSPEMTERKSV